MPTVLCSHATYRGRDPCVIAGFFILLPTEWFAVLWNLASTPGGGLRLVRFPLSDGTSATIYTTQCNFLVLTDNARLLSPSAESVTAHQIEPQISAIFCKACWENNIVATTLHTKRRNHAHGFCVLQTNACLPWTP